MAFRYGSVKLARKRNTERKTRFLLFDLDWGHRRWDCLGSHLSMLLAEERGETKMRLEMQWGLIDNAKGVWERNRVFKGEELEVGRRGRILESRQCGHHRTGSCCRCHLDA
ncbi:hypothetical protein M9H77_29890 [Catharanthus roseus]|uniref:Uncharacterized protein n=1 Tax=Catharanthus roseus TaxID=4058 RepID=A0ACB9ZZX6_CATRO|nr:hypothetical protein M9H77_29890 [Catharanthus roseus]